MALPATFSFTGTDGTALSATGSWGAYGASHNEAQIVTNACRCQAVGTDSANGWTADAPAANQYGKLKLLTLNTNTQRAAGVMVRCATTGGGASLSGYIGMVRGPFGATTPLEIWKFTSGSQATLTTGTAVVAANDILKVEATGSGTINVYINDVLKLTTTDASSPFASGGGGIYVFTDSGATSDSVVDDYEIGNIATGATITPAVGSLVLTGVAPVVIPPVFRTPAAGSLALTGQQPVVQILGTVVPGVATLALTGIAPKVIEAHTRIPGVGSLSFTGSAPVIGGSRIVTPSTGVLTLTGFASPQTLTVPPPDTGVLAITGVAPNRIIGIVRVPAAAALALTGIAPQVSQSGGPQNTTITPDTGFVVLTEIAPALTGSGTIRPNAGSLSFTGAAPQLNGNIVITPIAGILTFVSGTPGVTQQGFIAANAGQLALTGQQPQVSIQLGNPVTIQPATGALSLTGYAWVFPVLEGALPTVFLGAGVAVPAGSIYIGGAAFKPSTGERYVAAWPADNNVNFLGGFAHRPDGALIIDPAGTTAHRLSGIALTFRGETVTTVAAREIVHSGRSLLYTGKLCVTQQS